MRRPILVTAAVLALAAVAAAAARAQHAGHGSETAARHHRVHQAQEEFDRVIAEGRGAGLAFAADQNGYPGPIHVLEVKDRLSLTPVQEREMERLTTKMFAASRPKSAALLDAEARLRRLFADGIADEPRVRAAVAEVERARSEVRLVHLLTHLQTRQALSDEQRRRYHEMRWGR